MSRFLRRRTTGACGRSVNGRPAHDVILGYSYGYPAYAWLWLSGCGLVMVVVAIAPTVPFHSSTTKAARAWSRGYWS